MSLSPFCRLEAVPRITFNDARPELLARQRPLIITDALEGSSARRRWSLEHLKQIAGARSVPVEYSLRPIYRPHPKLNRGRYFRKEMSLAQCLDLIMAPHQRGAWHYLSALSIKEFLPELLSELETPALLPLSRYHSASLYLGNSGSGSQLHYDITDNLLAVFIGKKRVTLLPPGQLSQLYPLSPKSFACNTSRVNIEQREPERFPRFRDLSAVTAEVSAGELLYLPRTWWHHTVNEGLTLGVTFSWRAPMWELARWRYLRTYLPYLLEAFG